MNNHKHVRELGCLVLALTMLLGLLVPAAAASEQTAPEQIARLEQIVRQTGRYIYETVRKPQVGSVGGEWTVIGLARSGYPVPESYYRDYYSALEDHVKEADGVLHSKKYTEYSRVTVALSALGKDARDVAGYDLIKPLGDFEKTVWQGLNGPIWALIALDSRNYPMPKNPEAKTQATRSMYVDYILDCQLPGGGWNLYSTPDKVGGELDADITGMAFQALAKYQDIPEVKAATDRALETMSRLQAQDGGFSSTWDGASSESCVQMICGLSELGISLEDPRFVKNGNSILDSLLSFRQGDNGFAHIHGYGTDLMASEQGLYGITAALRVLQGKNSLYRMADAVPVRLTSQQAGQGLPGKDADVKPLPVTDPGKTFPDVSGAHAHRNQMAIDALAARGVLLGAGDGLFHPDDRMTRAEFAAMLVKTLGLKPKACDAFEDVKAADWFAPFVGTAYEYKLILGKGERKFDPNGLVTRQEGALMVQRAAKLCGMDTEMNTGAVRDALAPFFDYVTVESWAREGVAFCFQNGILDDSVENVEPKAPILRCEMAQMLMNLLEKARLL